jgi:hypothetical protein
MQFRILRRRFSLPRPSGAPWVAAWICLVAMAAQIVLPVAHQLEEPSGANDAAESAPSAARAQVRDAATSKRVRHVHDEATCPICRALSMSRAVVVPPPMPQCAAPACGSSLPPLRAAAVLAVSADGTWSARAPPARA